MKIGLLACDHIQKGFSDYPELFQALIPNYKIEVYNVCESIFPSSASECEAWIISGSKYSVYDDIDWIIRLKDFVRDISIADKYCIGICFGHQMLGEALGGRVEKAENGWCVGVHEFEIIKREDWMFPYQPKVNLLMSCQDQIKAIPPNSEVLAKSKNCKVGIIKIGDKMLGIQGHPEFSANYVKYLIELRGNKLDQEIVNEGIESLAKSTHNRIVVEWIEHFLGKR